MKESLESLNDGMTECTNTGMKEWQPINESLRVSLRAVQHTSLSLWTS